MTAAQRVWWEQARSDYAVLLILQREPAGPCHQLHYLQMTTEKLAKAYLWRDGRPPLSHASFVRFLQALVTSRSNADAARIAPALGFPRPADLRAWVRQVTPLAHAVEQLAPALAGDGPNAEYPWPRDAPAHAPATFEFPVWERLQTRTGRQLFSFLAAAVRTSPTYA